jgi:hypothetical protein
MVHSVMVKVSPKQMSKLRNGHKVRVKPPMEGEGVCLIVHPENYSLLSRTFSRGKGAEIALSPEEVVANKEASPQMEGQGIFGKKFDRGLRKLIGKKAQRELYGVAEQFLPLAQAGLTAGLTTGATALGAVQPELIPFLPAGVAGLSALGGDYLANPSKYQGKAKVSSLAKEYAKDLALQKLNQELGTNMGDLSRASINKAVADKASAELAKAGIDARTISNPYTTRAQELYGNGLGTGLYAGRMRKSGGAVGLNAGMVRQLPPALQSQPFSANFQFQATLPPAYQKFSKGSGLYV